MTAMLLAAAARAEVTLPELAQDASYARTQLADLSMPRMAAVLEELRKLQGLTPRSDALTMTLNGNQSVLVTELDNEPGARRRLFLFYLVEPGESFFLQLQVGADGNPEMRLWGTGPSELVVAGDQMRLLEKPSSETFRLPRDTAGAAASITITDAISCIARALSIGLDSTSLTTSLSSPLCSATSTISLALTACSCLSIAGVGSNLVFATIGCITGITKLISCSLVNCQSSGSCTVMAIDLNTTVSSSWNSACSSTHRSGRYAKFYTFSLASTTTVTIDLSSSVDAYLYLLQGSGAGGSVITYDDDSGPGTDSRIVRTLGPGSYTVETTTYYSGRAGSFSLSIRPQ
jgi:hypothetical protein